MRSKLFAGVIGVVVTLLLVAILGAVYGAAVGIPVYGPEYGFLKGIDGALLGVATFLLWGSLPAVVLGAIAGRLLITRRKSTSPTGG